MERTSAKCRGWHASPGGFPNLQSRCDPADLAFFLMEETRACVRVSPVEIR